MPFHNPPGFISSHIKVKKSVVSKKAWRWIEKRLNFYHHKTDTLIQIYDEDETYLYLPRGAFLRNDAPEFPSLSEQRAVRPASIPDPIVKLRPKQSAAVKKLRKRGGGVLRAATGAGKTFMMLYLAGKLKQKTLVLVHTVDLKNQWIKESQKVLGVTPTVIGDGEWDESGAIVIATVQTLGRYDMNKAPFADSYGMVIVDECHRTPAASFQKVAAGMSARYLYGCSATPTRPDGMHPVMHAILGPVVASVGQDELVEDGKLVLPTVKMVRSGFNSFEGRIMATETNQHKRNALFRKATTQLIHDEKRNRVIADLIIKNKNRFTLVLSERIEHLENIYDLLLKIDPTVDVQIITGATPKDEREAGIQAMRDGKLHVIMSTKLAKEGLDIPRCDTLIKTYPTKSKEPIIQEVGRIMRTHPKKKDAKVYDIVDNSVPTLRAQAVARRNLYRSRGMKVRGWKPKAG